MAFAYTWNQTAGCTPPDGIDPGTSASRLRNGIAAPARGSYLVRAVGHFLASESGMRPAAGPAGILEKHVLH